MTDLTSYTNGSFTGYTVNTVDLVGTTEPVTLSDVKEYSRIDGSTEDTLLTSLITMARLHCESYISKCILQKTVTVESFTFPWQFQLPLGPLEGSADVSKVVTLDKVGTETNLEYEINTGLFPKIHILGGSQSYKFKMVYQAGFTTVPEDIKLAIKMMVNTLYERREDFSDLNAIPSPLGVKALLMPYKTYNWFGA